MGLKTVKYAKNYVRIDTMINNIIMKADILHAQDTFHFKAYIKLCCIPMSYFKGNIFVIFTTLQESETHENILKRRKMVLQPVSNENEVIV